MGMETFADLLTTGDPVSLVVAAVSFAAAGLLTALAVHLRPRPRRRIAR